MIDQTVDQFIEKNKYNISQRLRKCLERINNKTGERYFKYMIDINKKTFLKARINGIKSCNELEAIRSNPNNTNMIKFEDENGEVILKTYEYLFVPNKGDLIHLKGDMYEVKYRYIDYDRKQINIDIIRC